MKLDELVSAAKSLDAQPPPPDAEARMWGKIAARIGGAVGLGAAGLGAKTASASTAAAGTSVATSSVAVTVAKVGTALALTAGIGAGVVTATAEPEPAPVVEAREVAPPPAKSASSLRGAPAEAVVPAEDIIEVQDIIEAEAPEPEPPAPKARPRRKAKPAVAPAQPATLAEESALLGRARVASARGKHRDALAALRAHTKQFPRGELVEVRRALEVRVLCDLGQPDKARKAADRFLKHHRSSALAGQVRASCAFDER